MLRRDLWLKLIQIFHHFFNSRLKMSLTPLVSTSRNLSLNIIIYIILILFIRNNILPAWDQGYWRNLRFRVRFARCHLIKWALRLIKLGHLLDQGWLWQTFEFLWWLIIWLVNCFLWFQCFDQASRSLLVLDSLRIFRLQLTFRYCNILWFFHNLYFCWIQTFYGSRWFLLYLILHYVLLILNNGIF